MGDVGGAVADDPAVIISRDAVVIAVAGPTGINHPIDQRQGTPFLIGPGPEGDRGAPIALAGRGGPNGLGAVGGLGTGRDIKGVQGLGVGGDPAGDRLGHGHKVHNAGGRVDDRGIRDSDLGGDLGTVPDVSQGYGHGATGEETGMPVGNPRRVGVKGIGAVVFGNYVSHIVGAPADADVGHVKGLGVYLAVHRVREKFSEIGTVDVGGGEDGFILVPTIAGLVVMVSGQGGLGESLRGPKEGPWEKEGRPKAWTWGKIGISKRKLLQKSLVFELKNLPF